MRLTFTMLPMRPSRLMFLLCLVAVVLAYGPLSAATRHVPVESQNPYKNSAGKSSPAASKSAKTGAGKKTAAKRSRRRRPRGQLAPTSERIREIQSALAGAGFYKTQPTGKLDSPSIEAMKRFQTAQGLQPTGKLDARSLQALGLGSEVAGQAPPRNPISPQPSTSGGPPGTAPPPPSPNGAARPTGSPPRSPAPKSAFSELIPPPR